jgi:hypothetical protein
MFFAEAQIRVHLYGQPTDMRKYAPTIIMRIETRRGCIVVNEFNRIGPS